MYDAIVVGARCAGAPTAMLLARRGYRVLLLDRAAFPSDTISTHIMWPPGAALLERWGLLDRVMASGCPPLETVTFDLGPFALAGSPLPFSDVSAFLAPRRTVLDQILVEAAVEAGVELHENCAVLDVTSEHEQVTGVRYRSRDGSTGAEHARIVIGADGRNSIIARAVNAAEYNARPPLCCWYYTYWSGVATDGVEFYSRPDRGIGLIPTNDELVCVPVTFPASEFHEIRDDIEGHYIRTVEQAPALAERLLQGKREARFVGLADLASFFRNAYGPGWALVGDAGYHKDPITAQGISDAFRSAQSLADAIDDGFSGRASLDDSLERYQRQRDEHVMPMYEFTCDWAALAPPPPHMEMFFAALLGNQHETDRFTGALAGTVPVPEVFSQENIERVIGAMR